MDNLKNFQEKNFEIVQNDKKIQNQPSKEAWMYEEAKRIAYLDAVRLDEVEDEGLRKAMAMVLSSQSMDLKEKCQQVQKLDMMSKLKSLMQKIDLLDQHEQQALNQYSLENARHILAKGTDISGSDMPKAQNALAVLQEEVNRAAQKRLAEKMQEKNDFSYGSSVPGEKKMAHYAAHMALELQKKRNQILEKTKIALGVA